MVENDGEQEAKDVEQKEDATSEFAVSVVSSLPVSMRPAISLDVYSKLLMPAAKISGVQNAVMNSGLVEALAAARKMSDLLNFQSNIVQILQKTQGATKLMSDCSGLFTKQWVDALNGIQKMDAPSFAMMRLLPRYKNEKLPRGSKSVMNALTKKAAKELAKTNGIFFEPKDGKFYQEEAPGEGITADQVTVVASSLALFESIGLDELVSFESNLCQAPLFAIWHPVGQEIYDIIKKWNTFVSFRKITYYHARSHKKGTRPFMDEEMLMAPLNVSSHGRYNGIGRSCYYIADTRDGAVNEIYKHSGGKKPEIQIVGIRAVKEARIIDLSGTSSKSNEFIEHLRYSVDNEEGKVVYQYLLPNFVAECCRKLGIEGIQYKSSETQNYNSIVLWNADYFTFVDGSREKIPGDS